MNTSPVIQNSTLSQKMKAAVFQLQSDGYLTALDVLTLYDLLDYSGLQESEQTDALAHVIISLIFHFNRGSLCVDLQDPDLINEMQTLLPDFSRSCQLFLDQIPNFQSLLTNGEEFKPLVWIKKEQRFLLYFHKYYHSEKRLTTCIHSVLAGQSNKADGNWSGLSAFLKNSPLNARQQLAVYLALRQNFTLISGGPGTGKTSLIYWMLKAFIKSGFDLNKIKLASPTGRASQRLNESIADAVKSQSLQDETDQQLLKLEGQTIHRLLQYSHSRNEFHYKKDCPLPDDIVIVDEASMIDIVLMTRLLEALHPGTKLILIGDKDQLPSVEAGSVLTDIIPHDQQEYFSPEICKEFQLNNPTGSSPLTDRVVVLNQSYRTRGEAYQAALKVNQMDTSVADQLTKINLQDIPSLLNKEKEKAFFINAEGHSPHHYHLLLQTWMNAHFMDPRFKLKEILTQLGQQLINHEKQDADLLNSLFQIIHQNKILCFLKRGLQGSNHINQVMKNLYMHHSFHSQKGSENGVPIILTQNDYFLNCYNGDTGILIQDKSGMIKALFSRNNQFLVYNRELLNHQEIAYAITVHKSQGSEYRDILIVLPENSDNPLLTKEVLYTAITRAKNNVFIYGTQEILLKTVQSQIKRYSGIQFYK